MSRPFTASLAIAIVTLIGLSAALAQAPSCSEPNCTFLPYLMKPEATPTPTVPPPTATLPPSGVFILNNHSYYVDSSDYLHIVGEVQNNTGQARQFIRITVNIFSGTGQLLDTDFTYTTLDELRPADKTCFHLLLKQPAGWASYQFEGISSSVYNGAFPALTIFNDSGAIDPTLGGYRIIGQVRNDGTSRVTYVQPIATLYNADGTVLDCDFTFVNSTDLDPGQTSAFEMLNYGRPSYTDVATYRLQTDGNVQ